MKVCRHCGVEKHSFEFNRDKSKKDGLSSWCKECVKNRSKQYRNDHKEQLAQYHHEYRQKNKDELKKYARDYRARNKDVLHNYTVSYSKNTRVANKERLYSFKRSCVKCGEDRKYVIDFHHINPDEKLFNISTVGSHYTNVDISNEVKKCVCLCRNCHTEFHYLYGRKPKEPVASLTEYLGGNPYEI